MESKILFTKSILKGSNKLTKQVLNVSRSEKNNLYNKTLNAYLKKFNMKFEDINTSSIEEIKTIARKWDTSKWIEDMNEKRSLKIYREFKGKLKEEKFYDNRDSSKLFFQARSNTMQLNTTRRHIGGDTKCELCNSENEDLIHFLLDCKGLEHKRNQQIMMKHRNQNKEKMACSMLFAKGNKEDIKNMIDKMYKYRLGIIISNESKKELQTRNKTKINSKQKGCSRNTIPGVV